MSHLFLFLSLVHTFPFVIQGMREIKPSSETFENVDNLTQLEWSWHVAHKVYYWSGKFSLEPPHFLSYRCHNRYGAIGTPRLAMLGQSTSLPQALLRTLQMASRHLCFAFHSILLCPLVSIQSLLRTIVADSILL